ncbi:glycosyltransferase family 2 protein [Polycyclovorans algicola]|uniref:glycosyltransferase family 2 protein n=1 Tax=Polycyclovorans algicola TaxID=616992 RepID=UPI0005BE6FF0|nr:glycosyltransferase family 2 protein [Polycyclovorans algicola]
MKLSVILSTFNAPHWLTKSLLGYAQQQYRDFEVVIADDGSTEETRALIARMRDETGLTLRHVWQRDDGFRKCRILNKAVLQAQGDYLLFSDGDCIPRRDFVAVHAARAAPGHWVAGSYYKLPMVTSQAITAQDIASGRCFDLRWLRAHGLPSSHKTVKLTATPGVARWLNQLTPARCDFKGANGAAWKADVLRVNGFDERMGYGSEDSEFGTRLLNAGIRARSVRYDAVCLHLDHPRGYVDQAAYARNRALRKHNQRQRVSRTDFGIAELQRDGYPRAAAIAN